LNYVLERVVKLLAPICPFISEKIYQEMFKGESIHLAEYPQEEKNKINSNLEKGMETVKQLIEAMNSARQEKRAKLRWPIDKAFVRARGLQDFQEVIKSMGNVKEVVFVQKVTGKAKEFEGGSLSLGAVMKDEALLRELVRQVQSMRKKQGLRVEEKIKLVLETDPATQKVLQGFESLLLEGTGSSKVSFGKAGKGKLEFQRKKIGIGF